MDPVCHTLVGAALGRTGLARRSALGMTALVLGANLPDIDVVAYFNGPAADLAFRRGWTHGVLALVVLPALLAGALILLHRTLHRWRRASLPSAIRPRELVFLSYLAALTHPVLDTLNTYGVRWLMPFSGQWFYGDTLFIVDPWVWLALGVGVYLSRKRRTKTGFRVAQTRPPKVALAAVAAYMIAMAVSGRIAEGMVRQELADKAPVQEVMVSPRPITPFTRYIVATRGDHYVTGTFRWWKAPHLIPGSIREYPSGYPTDPNISDALQTKTARRFLGWARFPTFRVRMNDGTARAVEIVDLRYADTPRGFGKLTVPIAGPLLATPELTPPASIPIGYTIPTVSSDDRNAPAP